MLGACTSTLRMSQSGNIIGGFIAETWCGTLLCQHGLLRRKYLVQEMSMPLPPPLPPKKDEVIIALLKMTRQPTKHLLKKDAGVPSTKPWELDPMVLDAPGKGEGIQVEIRSASKTVVDWIRGKARQGNVAWASVGNVQQQLQGMGHHDHPGEAGRLGDSHLS